VEAVAARAARDPRIPASLPEDWRGLLGAMTARDPALRPTALEVAVMARELAPQLAGWVPPVAAAEAEDTAPTVVHTTRRAGAAAAAGAGAAGFGAAALGATAAADTGRRTRILPTTQRRRRGILAGGIAAGSVLAVAATLALGSMMAPASETPQSVPTTPRPTPTIQAPPTTVAPVEATTEPQPTPEQTVQQPSGDTGDSGGKGGPGKGDGPGKGHGPDKPGKPDKGHGKGKD